MTDVQTSTGGADAGSSAAGVGAVATAPTSSGLKDPRQLAEAVLVKMLSIYEQLANANMLLSVPQVRVHAGPIWRISSTWLAVLRPCTAQQQRQSGLPVVQAWCISALSCCQQS